MCAAQLDIRLIAIDFSFLIPSAAKVYIEYSVTLSIPSVDFTPRSCDQLTNHITVNGLHYTSSENVIRTMAP